jgi:hypothetical protein
MCVKSPAGVRLLTHVAHLFSFLLKIKNKKETLKTRVEGNLSLSLSLSRTQQTSTHRSTGGQRPTDPALSLSLSRTQEIQELVVLSLQITRKQGKKNSTGKKTCHVGQEPDTSRTLDARIALL